MQIVTAHQGVLRTVRSGGLRGAARAGLSTDLRDPSGSAADPGNASVPDDLQVASFCDDPTGDSAPAFRTGLGPWDALAPGQAFARGVVHELLHPPMVPPRFVALLLAMAAMRGGGGEPRGQVAWIDPDGTLYPPALAAAGLPLDRLLIIRPKAQVDEIWAAAECLRCRGVAATVLEPGRLTRVQARRLQLAVEAGGGVGLFLRPLRTARHYAAATRWSVVPEPGTRTAQRWRLELLHGHGGQVHQPVILEVSRDIPPHSSGAGDGVRAVHPVCAYDAVADRPAAARATA